MTDPQGAADALVPLGIHYDLHSGSYLQKGVTTIFSTHAVRMGIIQGGSPGGIDFLGSDRDQLEKAIKFAVLGNTATDVAGFPAHPFTEPKIPLHHVRAWKFGPHAYFELYYRYTRTSLPPIAAATSSSFDTVYEHEPVHRRTLVDNTGDPVFFNGLPDGDLDLPDDAAGPTDKSNVPRIRIYKKAALRILVSTILTQSPMATSAAVVTFVNHLNSGAITFNSVALPFVFAAGEVRYDGVKVKWLGPFQYRVIYQFTVSPSGFFRQYAVYGGVPLSWDTNYEIKHEFADFANAFPVGL